MDDDDETPIRISYVTKADLCCPMGCVAKTPAEQAVIDAAVALAAQPNGDTLEVVVNAVKAMQAATA